MFFEGTSDTFTRKPSEVQCFSRVPPTLLQGNCRRSNVFRGYLRHFCWETVGGPAAIRIRKEVLAGILFLGWVVLIVWIMFYSFLFPQRFRGTGSSVLILILRLVFGVLFLLHGVDKMSDFQALSENYPSVMGLGSYMTLMITIFCEFCCSLFLIAGLLVRLMVLPMILAMAVAFFDVHDAMMPEGELSLIYLIVFIILYIVGPGRFSFDYLIDSRFRKDKEDTRLSK